ncbi:MAG: phenylacetate-CoA ligase [Natronomonas sp.]|jgi:phenylacetate-CoA ligase|uniref:phenylacetate--CoA ligase family protein n=1 Tax=Natronomonas sp. TaxID=2184060 RepID=UPI00398A482A
MRQLVRLGWRLRELARHAEMNREEILELREERFRDLLHHAWDKTDFYPEYYREHDISRDDLATIPSEELPSITKGQYIEHFDDLTTDDRLTRDGVEEFLETSNRDERFAGEYEVVHTSGTTGEPTHFVYSTDAWDTMLAGGARAVKGDQSLLELTEEWLSGYRIAYVAATEGRFGGAMVVRGGTDAPHIDSLFLDINRPMDEWEAEFRDFRPNVLVGYPSAIKLVCDIEREADLGLDIERIAVGGEPLSAELREYIEDTFGTEVLNIYGASESLIIGLERSGHDGMYLYDDLNYVEPADEVTYVTPLYNRTQPLIRYELDDKLEPAERGEDEPLPFTKVESVVGRSEDLMWFETRASQRDAERASGEAASHEEEFLHPLVIDDIDTEGLIRYQFRPTGEESIEMRMELTDDADRERVEADVSEQFDAILDEKGLRHIEYDLVEVEEIPVDPDTGKRKMVVTEE